MIVFGIDFTSTPGVRKPIAWARARLRARALHVESVTALTSWPAFEAALRAPGPWVAGLDFPFGLPDELLVDWAAREGWPLDWPGYVARAGAFAAAEWRRRMRAEAAARPPGRKYLFRPVDRWARAASPLNVVHPPVGMMFHAGAPRLLAAARALEAAGRPGLRVPPHLPGGDAERVALETYPRLVADFALGTGRAYKGRPAGSRWPPHSRTAEDARRAQRRATILEVIEGRAPGATGGGVAETYGHQVCLSADLRAALIADPEGDLLDAVLCTLPAAWAHTQRDDPGATYGIPPGHERSGWIVDPAMLAAWQAAT